MTADREERDRMELADGHLPRYWKSNLAQSQYSYTARDIVSVAPGATLIH